jgi:hypothetical protein
MPSPKQMDKLAAQHAAGRSVPRSDPVGPVDELPPEYWQAILDDVSTESQPAADSIATRRLCDIGRHLLRVGCQRCGRTVEIQTVDAIRLYGPESIWKAVGLRLLDDTCQIRTGRYEEDGCWPSFE